MSKNFYISFYKIYQLIYKKRFFVVHTVTPSMPIFFTIEDVLKGEFSSSSLAEIKVEITMQYLKPIFQAISTIFSLSSKSSLSVNSTFIKTSISEYSSASPHAELLNRKRESRVN
jgi:hypothetical protein